MKALLRSAMKRHEIQANWCLDKRPSSQLNRNKQKRRHKSNVANHVEKKARDQSASSRLYDQRTVENSGLFTTKPETLMCGGWLFTAPTPNRTRFHPEP